MTQANELMKAALYAMKNEEDYNRAAQLCRSVLADYPESTEAERAKLLLARLEQEYLLGDATSTMSVESQSSAVTVDVAIGSRYGTARIVASIVEFIGWLTVATGIVIGLMFFAEGGQLLSVLPVIAIGISGLFMVMGGQMIRAMADTADTARLVLAELRDRRTP